MPSMAGAIIFERPAIIAIIGSPLVSGSSSPDYCVKLRVYERLQQGAAVEKRDDVRDELRDASYELLGMIGPDVQSVLVKHMVIADPRQVARTEQSDAAGQQYYTTAQVK